MNVIYTDGSCNLNIPSAGAGVFFKSRPEWNISCFVPGRQTNQRAELYAIYKALEKLVQEDTPSTTENKNLARCCIIMSDSLYSIRVVTREWKAKTNLDLVHPIWAYINQLKQNQWEIQWKHVRAHTGIHGNEMADHLANKARKEYEETILSAFKGEK